MRQSGWILAMLGLAGIIFLWMTDPRYGVFRGPSASLIDRANESVIGTIVGLSACVVVLLVGVWLGTRRRI